MNYELEPVRQTDDFRIIEGKPFYKINGANTAPIGMAWFNNGKSRFRAGYISVLLPEFINKTTNKNERL